MDSVDISALFPDYERAEAVLGEDSDMAELRLWQGGTYAHMHLNVDRMHDSLERIRKAQRAARGERMDTRIAEARRHE